MSVQTRAAVVAAIQRVVAAELSAHDAHQYGRDHEVETEQAYGDLDDALREFENNIKEDL